MPRCEDCREAGAQPCQGDLVLCQRCSDKRFPPSGSGSEAVCKDVIINDLLCFTVNKMDTLPFDIITKLCTETYMGEEIESAKRLVFDTWRALYGKPAAPLPTPTMPRCEDCREAGAQPCQGDLVLCQRCSDKRFPPSGSGSEAVCKDVIINDLLCFTVNKMDTLPFDIITKLCTETYMDEEIESAKRLVFDTCKPDERYIKRKGGDKSTANMEDIQRVLHSTAPPSLPTFVSATLHLPAVSLEHVDISVCMQELQIMRQEMKLIRDCSIDSAKFCSAGTVQFCSAGTVQFCSAGIVDFCSAGSVDLCSAGSVDSRLAEGILRRCRIGHLPVGDYP
uniref:Uncharacterized protein n=1 Tax=Branchiostoma floridae TaxID=7739 RepID=C3YY00_BRAFL|eukprot:XP_002598947.1 hypothetical protein BRAFLDRAFT_79877 [Branchiostoma floridae]